MHFPVVVLQWLTVVLPTPVCMGNVATPRVAMSVVVRQGGLVFTVKLVSVTNTWKATVVIMSILNMPVLRI